MVFIITFSYLSFHSTFHLKIDFLNFFIRYFAISFCFSVLKLF